MNRKLSIFVFVCEIVTLVLFTTLFVLFTGSFADLLVKEGMSIPGKGFIYIFAVILYLPVLVILLMSLKIPDLIKSDRIFTNRTAWILSTISFFMLVEAVLILIASSFLLTQGEKTVSLLLLMTDIVALALTFLLRVLSEFIKSAAILKEEADLTL